VIEDNLVVLVLVTAVVGVTVPRVGTALSGLVTPLLALLMLAVSLSFDLNTLRRVLARPGIQVLATVLVYGPMGVVGFLVAGAAFGSGPLWLGTVLVGVLPTDVSSPLLVWLARGNVALASVANAINTALAPVLVPWLFLAWTGVELDVPVIHLVAELAVTVVVPTIVGVSIRTRLGDRLLRVEPALSATGSLAYLALLLAVVGPNADLIVDQPATVALAAMAGLAINMAGYLLGGLVGRGLSDPGDRIALLFTVSKKEFSIAAFVVFSAGLPTEVALPAVVYAVVQMITSPVVARRLAQRERADTVPR
jgi:bile acid:Na+ symporter, BASS family